MTQLALQWETEANPIEFADPSTMMPWPGLNPRKHISEETVEEMAASIRENGVLQNLVVQRRAAGKDWIISGETRWRGASRAGARVPVRYVQLTEAQALTIALLENLGRKNLTALEEAEAFQRLIDLEPELTQAAIAERFGIDQSQVANRLALLDLPTDFRAMIDGGIIAPSVARDVLVPWTREDPTVSERFFRMVLSLINSRPDASDPVRASWLQPVIDRVRPMLRPGVSAAPAPAEQPRAAANPPQQAGRKKATRAKKSAPESGVQSNVLNALISQPVTGSKFEYHLKRCSIEEAERAIEAVKLKPNSKSRIAALEKRITELKAKAEAAASQPAPAPVEETEIDEAETPTEHSEPVPADEQVHVPGLFGALLPFMQHGLAVNINVAPFAGGKLYITATPRRVDTKKDLPALIVCATPDAVEAELLAKLPAFIEQTTAKFAE